MGVARDRLMSHQQRDEAKNLALSLRAYAVRRWPSEGELREVALSLAATVLRLGRHIEAVEEMRHANSERRPLMRSG